MYTLHYRVNHFYDNLSRRCTGPSDFRNVLFENIYENQVAGTFKRK